MSETSFPEKAQPAKGSQKARRSAARMAAVQAVYQMKLGDQSGQAVIEEFMAFRLGKPVDGHDMVLPEGTLFRDIVMGVAQQYRILDSFVLSALSKRGSEKGSSKTEEQNRTIEPLLHAILLCGAFELYAHHEIDAPIIISDYLNVTHAFYDQGEDRLVNGALDAICKMIR